MIALGVDTSNYATSLALVNTGRGEVVCALKRFLPVEQGKTGIRQSDAVFHHTKALPEALAELEEKAPGLLSTVQAVGVSIKPRPVEGSYMPCFLAGYSFAQAFAAGRGLPLCKTTHQQGHLAAALFGSGCCPAEQEDFLFLHVSGGTTELLLARGYNVVKPLGTSLDLYAGQAVDRLGVKLGFPFPAGEQLSALAAGCTEELHPKVSVSGMDCHLSGLENQCDALLGQGKPPAAVARYCLLFIAETLNKMLANARKIYPNALILCAGGVMASDTIRTAVKNRHPGAHFSPPRFSSDNAIGTALIAAKEAEQHG